jgi:plasmid maintenance system antidote protein VapI
MSKKTKKLDPTLAETIRKKIVESELSQYRIAKESGVSAGVINRFVSGERSISLDNADKLCKVLGLHLTNKDNTKDE